MWLLPPSLDEMIPEDHVVRFVAAFVDNLDLSELGLWQSDAPRGGLAYDARVLLSAWLYGFMTGVRSTRRLERLTYENVPMMWLLGRQHPDHSTLARFLQKNRQAMKGLFKRTVCTAVDVGLVDFAFQAIDGTRVGNVSRDKALRREELLALNEKLERVLVEMEEEIEREEEEGAGDAHRMPEALRNPKVLHEHVQAALEELDRREERRRANKAGARDEETGERKGPPVSLADPEAVLMKGSGGYVMGYNAQVAVDSKAQVIVAAEVVADATDNAQQVLMLRETEETAGRLAEVTALDGGYHSAENLEATQGLETDLYVTDPSQRRAQARPERSAFHKDAFVYQAESDSYLCPAGQTLRLESRTHLKTKGGRIVRRYRCQACHGCPHYGVCTTDRRGRAIRVREQEHLLRQHRKKMSSETAKGYMRRRAAVVEPVFGVLKEHMGLRRFLRRGLENVRAEWQLLCAAYNVRKLWKYCPQAFAVRGG